MATITTEDALMTFACIALNVQPHELQEGAMIPRDMLLDPDKYEKLKPHISILKKIFSSKTMTSMHSGAENTQKWPGLNLVRQVLKRMGFDHGMPAEAMSAATFCSNAASRDSVAFALCSALPEYTNMSRACVCSMGCADAWFVKVTLNSMQLSCATGTAFNVHSCVFAWVVLDWTVIVSLRFSMLKNVRMFMPK
jgi:hypothetical protein